MSVINVSSVLIIYRVLLKPGFLLLDDPLPPLKLRSPICSQGCSNKFVYLLTTNARVEDKSEATKHEINESASL